MDQFLGEFSVKLDDKGRLLLPAKFRGAFAEGITVTRSPDGCLRGFRTSDFVERLKKLQQAEEGGRRKRRATRMVASAAADQVPDSQGRVTLPQTLRQFAKLDRELMVAGVGDAIEIWSLPAWEEELALAEEEFSGLEEGEYDF